jgi:hypothetical protein
MQAGGVSAPFLFLRAFLHPRPHLRIKCIWIAVISTAPCALPRSVVDMAESCLQLATGLVAQSLLPLSSVARLSSDFFSASDPCLQWTLASTRQSPQTQIVDSGLVGQDCWDCEPRLCKFGHLYNRSSQYVSRPRNPFVGLRDRLTS